MTCRDVETREYRAVRTSDGFWVDSLGSSAFAWGLKCEQAFGCCGGGASGILGPELFESDGGGC